MERKIILNLKTFKAYRVEDLKPPKLQMDDLPKLLKYYKSGDLENFVKSDSDLSKKISKINEQTDRTKNDYRFQCGKKLAKLFGLKVPRNFEIELRILLEDVYDDFDFNTEQLSSESVLSLIQLVYLYENSTIISKEENKSSESETLINKKRENLSSIVGMLNNSSELFSFLELKNEIFKKHFLKTWNFLEKWKKKGHPKKNDFISSNQLDTESLDNIISDFNLLKQSREKYDFVTKNVEVLSELHSEQVHKMIEKCIEMVLFMLVITDTRSMLMSSNEFIEEIKKYIRDNRDKLPQSCLEFHGIRNIWPRCGYSQMMLIFFEFNRDVHYANIFELGKVFVFPHEGSVIFFNY